MGLCPRTTVRPPLGGLRLWPSCFLRCRFPKLRSGFRSRRWRWQWCDSVPFLNCSYLASIPDRVSLLRQLLQPLLRVRFLFPTLEELPDLVSCSSHCSVPDLGGDDDMVLWPWLVLFQVDSIVFIAVIGYCFCVLFQVLGGSSGGGLLCFLWGFKWWWCSEGVSVGCVLGCFRVWIWWCWWVIRSSVGGVRVGCGGVGRVVWWGDVWCRSACSDSGGCRCGGIYFIHD